MQFTGDRVQYQNSAVLSTGDLAEVIVNQGPRVGAVAQNISIGTNSRWNDTLLPRHHYIFPPDGSIIDWHLTDAEMLAGIDGMLTQFNK